MSDMGSPDRLRQSFNGRPAPGQKIVAFDFDGTLTTHDSFTAFLKWRAGGLGWAAGLLKMAPALAAYIGDRDRGRIKAASVAVFLKGVPETTLETDAGRYADHVWARFMRPDALACWNDWGAKGAWRVIVTASPETTVAPFAQRLGADDLIGTQLAFDAENRVTGAFATPNCRRDEKVRRLRKAYGEDVVIEAAYGDTSGDTEMLKMADQPGFRIFTQKP